MFRAKRIAVCAALLAGFAACAGTASAATAKLEGTAFDVYYDDALLGLFGAPALAGDVLYFTPTTFSAASLNGSGVASTYSTINLIVELNSGYSFSSVSLLERGDYRMRGASSEVDVLGQLRVFDTAAPLGEVNDRLASAAALDMNDGLNYNWTATAGVGLDGDQWAGTQAINVTIENILDAYSDPQDAGRKQAFIEKKFVGLSVAVAPVPEPDSYALMLAGLGMLGVVARRRAR